MNDSNNGFFHRVLVLSIEEKLLPKIRKKLFPASKACRHSFAKRISACLRYVWAKRQKIDTNKIVFMTYSNKYECNPKYIAEELIRRNRPYELIWLAPPKASYKASAYPSQCTVYRRNSFDSLLARATAKIWIDNSINFTWNICVPKKKNQIYLETWHGSMGLKRLISPDHTDNAWANMAKKCGKTTDFCISNSSFEDHVFQETYWGNTPILKYGHARNDILLDQSKDRQRQLKYHTLVKLKQMPATPDNWKELSTEAQEEILAQQRNAWNTHYVLYAPTFRDSATFDCYNLDFDRLLDCLQKKWGGEKWKVLLRYHFHNREAGAEIKLDQCINATRYTDIQELLCLADVGITDYSSWICDYALTGKPGFIYAVDLKEYNTERGLYYPLGTLPYPVATNNEELFQMIQDFDSESFEQKRQAFLTKMGCVEDGHAAERIADKIDELMGFSNPSC